MSTSGSCHRCPAGRSHPVPPVYGATWQNYLAFEPLRPDMGRYQPNISCSYSCTAPYTSSYSQQPWKPSRAAPRVLFTLHSPGHRARRASSQSHQKPMWYSVRATLFPLPFPADKSSGQLDPNSTTVLDVRYIPL